MIATAPNTANPLADRAASILTGIAPEEIAAIVAADQDTAGDAPRDPNEAELRLRFHITDRAGLSWYAAKLAAIAAERETVKAQAAKILAALDADEKSLKHLYDAEAEETTARLLAEGGNRKKSIDTLHGTFGFRAQPAALRLVDADAALPHAHALGCTKVEIATAAYLAKAEATKQETGDLLPGIELAPGRDAFGVSFAKARRKGGITTPEEITETATAEIAASEAA